MPKKVGGEKGKEEQEQPAISINFSQPADVAEIVTATESSKPVAQKQEGQPSLTAQEILETLAERSPANAERSSADFAAQSGPSGTKSSAWESESELQKLGVGKREANNLAQTFRIITAILLGKNKNKELAQALNTDKSFASKQVKELEEQGLVKKEEDGREVKYVVDPFNVMKFLQSKVIIKVKNAPVKETGQASEGVQNGGKDE